MKKMIGVFGVVILSLWGEYSAGQSAGSSSGCNNAPMTISVLTKPDDGWDVAFAKKAKVVKQGPFMIQNGKESQDSGLTVVVYEAKKRIITLPKIEVNTCDRSGTIKNWYLIPTQVLGLKKNGRLFAYELSVELAGGPTLGSGVLGADMQVMFYDMQGHGVFEVVRIASGVGLGVPVVPDWIQTVPSRSGNSTMRPPR
jgi:hypothetical protein